MKKPVIAVLFGGCSSEYAISLQSAHGVLTHLDWEKYQILPVGITREGRWFQYTGGLDAIPADTWHQDAAHCTPAVISPDRGLRGLLLLPPEQPPVPVGLDAAFPVLHGKNGEDGTVQGLLELAGIPVVGCGCLSSAVCMDKELAHRLALAEGVAVPKGILLRAGADLTQLPERTAALAYPLFVKPSRAGSSFGVSRVEDPRALRPAVEEALTHDDKVLIEQAVSGAEVGCAVLGSDVLTVGRADEIELSHGFFDYVEKYNLITSRIHMPARIPPEQEEQVRHWSQVLYRAMECRGFARVDWFLTPDGELVFNEINTIPGFTAHSRYPRMMEGVGLSFSQVLDTLIGLAVAP